MSPDGSRDHAAVVTGISRGLGAALVEKLLAQGFTVLGIGRTSNPALVGGRFTFVQLDLADYASLDSVLAPALEELKRQRPASVCLLNNAGAVDPLGPLGSLSAREITTGLTVNLASAVALANLFCRAFAGEEMATRIINISSGAAERAIPGEAVYCVAKAGLEMLTLALVADYEAANLRAITVRPGVIDSDMQAFLRLQTPDLLPLVEMFKSLHQEGQLVAPDVVASKIVERLVLAAVENGRTYGYQEL
jgi:benzil reductase ((S)-benzoin forming)